uniref:RBR-type E3 ubiquitin transferase n=1 Tax=Alexandrium andersonii TaxID=327968 RepID=A0A7S2MEC5_9DINO|mmetsp:Transcript_66745/g.149684  ORF Transcript_66745/g.149684 Transcript_66745/m.149684 type:complete len:361 (+) Transcript_66745:71-1153(+)
MRYCEFMTRVKATASSSRPSGSPISGAQSAAESLAGDSATATGDAASSAEDVAASTGDAAAASGTRRPPATPCSVKRAQVVVQAPTSSPVKTAGKILTPFSSPRAMRINSQAEVCEICCNDAAPWQAVRLGCGHGWYCSQCIQRHSEARLELGTASVTCPECCAPLAERDLRKLLPQELMDRLLARSLEQAISSTADLWACPTPNCPMRVALGDGEIPRFRCSLCKRESCLRCAAHPYHKGMTCEEYAEKMREKRKRKQMDDGEDSFQKWMEETGTKQCPTCRMAVTKQNLEKQATQRSECHKMFCRNCNTKFCFKCLAVLTDQYTCRCTIDAHGFINPHTGRRLNHLRRGRSGGVKAGR